MGIYGVTTIDDDDDRRRSRSRSRDREIAIDIAIDIVHWIGWSVARGGLGVVRTCGVCMLGHCAPCVHA